MGSSPGTNLERWVKVEASVGRKGNVGGSVVEGRDRWGPTEMGVEAPASTGLHLVGGLQAPRGAGLAIGS